MIYLLVKAKDEAAAEAVRRNAASSGATVDVIDPLVVHRAMTAIQDLDDEMAIDIIQDLVDEMAIDIVQITEEAAGNEVEDFDEPADGHPRPQHHHADP